MWRSLKCQPPLRPNPSSPWVQERETSEFRTLLFFPVYRDTDDFFHHLWGNVHQATRRFQMHHVVRRFVPRDELFCRYGILEFLNLPFGQNKVTLRHKKGPTRGTVNSTMCSCSITLKMGKGSVVSRPYTRKSSAVRWRPVFACRNGRFTFIGYKFCEVDNCFLLVLSLKEN